MLTTVLSSMNFLDSTIEISVGGTILHTKATTLRAGASHSPILQSIITAFEGQSDATTVGNGVWPQGCGYIPRASFVIDRDGCGWRHVMNYLRALELDCDAAEMAEMVGFVDWRERQAAAVEARWLGLFKLEELLSNMAEFTRQGLQAINSAPNIRILICYSFQPNKTPCILTHPANAGEARRSPEYQPMRGGSTAPAWKFG